MPTYTYRPDNSLHGYHCHMPFCTQRRRARVAPKCPVHPRQYMRKDSALCCRNARRSRA